MFFIVVKHLISLNESRQRITDQMDWLKKNGIMTALSNDALCSDPRLVRGVSNGNTGDPYGD